MGYIAVGGRRFVRARLARSLGLLCVFAGMLTYRSENHAILGRWSPLFAAVLVLVGIVTCVSWWQTLRALPDDQAVPERSPLAFDLGMLAFGLAYLATAIEDSTQGGRLLDLDLTGSVAPVPAMLEWIALVFFSWAALEWVFGRVRGVARNVVLALTPVIVTLLVAEGLARMWTLAAPSPHFGNAGRIWVRRHVALNSEGFRDSTHALGTVADHRRLLLVGDSYAFGWGVSDVHDRFGERLASLLSQGGIPWESINTSQRDKHTLQEIGFLRRGLRYHPDLVVLLYVFNDIDYLTPVTPRPIVAEGPGSLRARVHPVRLLFLNSYLFQEVYARVRVMTIARDARVRSPFRVYDDSVLVTRHLADLQRFVATADSAGAAVAIVPMDLSPSVDSASLRRYERFVSRAAAAGLPVISIAHAFDGRAMPTLVVGPLDAHPNALGHRLAAEAAAGELRALWSAFAPHARPLDGPQLAGEARASLSR